MELLRRLLKVQAGLWGLWSVATLVAPAWVVETLLRQPAFDAQVWLRAAAVMGGVLALLMVLVSQKIEDLWWWSWAFAMLEMGTATVFASARLVRTCPKASPAWPWWALALINGALGAGLLVGMGRAGQERPFA